MAFRPSRRRWLGRALTASFLTVMMAGSALAQSPSPSLVPAAQPTLAGTWAPIADAPIAGRYGHAAAWTGMEMLIWGGSAGSQGRWDKVTRRERGGAAYDPSTDTWRFLARAPIPGLSFQVFAWTGTELLVWGRPDAWRQDRPESVGAAYDPGQDRWRKLAPGPLTAEGQVAGVWTGTELVVLDGIVDSEPANIVHHVAAYDPAADTWRQLPDLVALAPWSIGLAWTGQDLYAVANPNEDSSTLHRLDGDAWTPIATPLEGLMTGPELVWTGTEVYTPDGAAAYDPAAGTWRQVAPGAGAGCGQAVNLVWTGELILDGPCDAYEPAQDRWWSLPASPDRPREYASSVWTGDRMIIWGGGDGSETIYLEPDGIAFSPAAAP
jgi:hypothetical protein